MSKTITAALVQELRARTGAGMMDCKKALQEADGDLEKAAEAMRKSGQIQAEKKAGRVAAEGLILIKSNEQSRNAVILEINCETDFVSRDENFKQFADAVAQTALDNQLDSVEKLSATHFAASQETIETVRQNLIAKLGENIQIRRLALFSYQSKTHVGAYVHGGRIGAIVEVQGGDEQLARDLALHIIANNPLVISAEDVPDEILAKEREIFTAQAQLSGKPQAIIEKMVAGRMDKFLDEVTLLGQAFIKDPTLSVKDLLVRSHAKLLSFVRFAVGEGIEKSTEGFAEAVMAQVKAS
jgi:elongation factor Ts